MVQKWTGYTEVQNDGYCFVQNYLLTQLLHENTLLIYSLLFLILYRVFVNLLWLIAS